MEVWLLDEEVGGEAEEEEEETATFEGEPDIDADEDVAAAVAGAKTNSLAFGLKTKALALGFKSLPFSGLFSFSSSLVIRSISETAAVESSLATTSEVAGVAGVGAVFSTASTFSSSDIIIISLSGMESEALEVSFESFESFESVATKRKFSLKFFSSLTSATNFLFASDSGSEEAFVVGVVRIVVVVVVVVSGSELFAFSATSFTNSLGSVIVASVSRAASTVPIEWQASGSL